MPPRRPARPAPPDVAALQAALHQGKIVRVGIAPSDQFPSGVTGRVRRIGDPAVDGEEFIFVEVPVGGAKDVLPFAVTDLTAPPGQRRAAAAAAPLFAPPGRPDVVEAPKALAPTAKPTLAPDPVPAEARGAARSTAAARGKRAPVTITISSTGDDSAVWRVEARIGAKVSVRPTVVPPSRVWEIVESLGEPRLTSMVQSLLNDHRRSTQARADALAAELSALQLELLSFPEKENR